MSTIVPNGVAVQKVQRAEPIDFDLVFVRPLIQHLWTASRMSCAQVGADNCIFKGVDYAYRLPWYGVHARKKIVGITKDSAGTALGGCTLKLFQTSNNEYIESNVSDPVGNYELYTPYDTAHFVVAKKAGSPDVVGGTTDTVVGV